MTEARLGFQAGIQYKTQSKYYEIKHNENENTLFIRKYDKDDELKNETQHIIETFRDFIHALQFSEEKLINGGIRLCSTKKNLFDHYIGEWTYSIKNSATLIFDNKVKIQIPKNEETSFQEITQKNLKKS